MLEDEHLKEEVTERYRLNRLENSLKSTKWETLLTQNNYFSIYY